MAEASVTPPASLEGGAGGDHHQVDRLELGLPAVDSLAALADADDDRGAGIERHGYLRDRS